MKRKKFSYWIIITALILSILLIGGTLVFAIDPPSYQDYEGNIDGIVKVDPPTNQIYYFDSDNNVSSTPTEKYIQFTVSDDQKSLAFQSVNILVYRLYLKGGDGYRVYSWLPQGTNEASGLICPLNDGGQVPTISHYGLLETGIPTETTTTTTECTTTTETTQPTTTETTQPTTECTTTTETTQPTTTETTQPTTTGTTSTTAPTTQITTTTLPTTSSTETIPKTGEQDNSPFAIILGIMSLLVATLLIFFKKRIIRN